jgi:uncharacterized membrane protein
MIVLVVLGVTTVLTRLARTLGPVGAASWPAAVRVGLASTLLVTGSAHFTTTRHDLAAMVPPVIPRPMALVFFTGLCELLAAAGLLMTRTRPLAATSLIAFLLAVLPANVHAARAGVQLRGKPPTPLALRMPLQAFLILLTWWSGLRNASK